MKKYYLLIPVVVAALFSCEKPAANIPEVAIPEIAILPDGTQVCEDLSPFVFPGEGPECSIEASCNPSTRSSFSMNPGGAAATLLWRSNDTFQTLLRSEGSWYAYTYKTTDDGTTSATFTGNTPSRTGEFFSFHPKYYKFGRTGSNSETYIFGVDIPTEQTAVAGGYADTLNRAFAYSDAFTTNLKFKNVCSVLKFRLAGDIVSEIRSVTLKTDGYISGNLVFKRSADTLQYASSNVFNGDSRSDSIILRGTFQPDTDYYIVANAKPCSTFKLICRNESGRPATKMASKTVNLQRSRVTDIGTVDLSAGYDGSGGSYVETVEVEHYLSSTKAGAKPVTLVVIPDGYVQSDMNLFKARARAAIDFLFTVEPYKTYKEYFSAWIISVNSRESGASVTDGNGNITTSVDTYFGSRWGASSYSDMKANENTIFNFVSTNCPEIVSGQRTINDVPVLMLINDTRYGGINWNYYPGKSYCMVPFQRSGATMQWSYPSIEAVSATDPSQGTRSVTSAEKNALGISRGDWRYTVTHEYGGHGFAKLADEYWSTTVKSATSTIINHYYPVPTYLNVSPTYDNTPWQYLLDIKESLVESNPLYDRIGVYHGGFTSPLNYWRSEKTSCMIDNRPYFSTWQREIIVQRILKLAGETFNWHTFFDKDVATDPLRDAGSSSVAQENLDDIPVMPMLPPPVWVDAMGREHRDY